MKREIINTTAVCVTDINMANFVDEPIKWLSQQMRAHTLKYLLAHADDGVIWGRLEGEELITSHDVAPEHSPPLRTETLQTARIFAPTGELLIWHNEEDEWAGRLITEDLPGAAPEWMTAFDERQILLGTYSKPRGRGFALMNEGSQGLCHVVPLDLAGPIDLQRRPLQLVVRHYLKADDYHFMRVDASRLRDLLLEPEESNI